MTVPLYTTAFSPTTTWAPITPPGNMVAPSPMELERETTARGWTRAGAATPALRMRSKRVARRANAVFPTPTTAPSSLPSRARATKSSSRPSTPGPGLRSVKPTTVHPHSPARSATARPCAPAPRISSRPATPSSPAPGGKRRATRPQEQLGQEKIPLGVNVDRRLEVHHHSAIILAEDVAESHEGRIARDVHRPRRLIHGRRVLAPDELVPVGKEGDGPIALEHVHEVWVIGSFGERLGGVRARLDHLLNGHVDLRARAERRGRLEGHNEIWPHPGRGFEPAHGMLEHAEHARLVARQLVGTQEGHLRPMTPRLLGDLRAVRGDDEAR